MTWSVLYWVLLVLAGLVLLRGLLWDRAGFRGRPGRRCRRCWYDLTGAEIGEDKEGEDPARRAGPPGGVVCPECGKGHQTRRSMRRTRRGKKWIAAALVLWVMAYGAAVTPRIQRAGWGAAVPRVVVVASLPFLSEESGSGLTKYGAPARILPSSSMLDSLVLKEIPPSNWGWGSPGQDAGYGWFSRRLAFFLARFESKDVLCDRTSVKGAAYKGLLSALVQNGRAYDFESAWAEQVVFVHANIDRAFGPKEPVYGYVLVRRLIDGAYRVGFGTDFAEYNCSTSTGLRMSGMFPAGRTAEEERQDWVDRHLWDSIHLVEMSASFGGYDSPGYPLGTGKYNGDGTATLSLSLRYMRYIGPLRGDRSDSSNWEYAFTHVEEIRYPLAASRTIQVDSSIELQGLIERSMDARLTVEFDRFKNKWVPVIKLDNRGRWPTPLDTIIFGGRISVVQVDRDKPEGHGMPYLTSGPDSWWLWGVEQYTEYAIERSGEDPLKSERVKRTGMREVLHPECSSSGFLAGELNTNSLAIRKSSREDTKLAIRIEYQHSPQQFNYGGLWGNRVYEGMLQFDLEDWTPIQLKRYIVNGIVPDHALPGGG